MPVAIPLARWADGKLAELATLSGSDRIAGLSGQGLLGERAMLGGFRIPGMVSAGGGCRLYETRNGAVALNLAREADRELLPALFETEEPVDLAARMAEADALSLTLRGRELGLAIASELEAGARANPAVRRTVESPAAPPSGRKPIVLDLAALWAGPLAAHLLWLAGAKVTKVESRNRPDAMREGDAGFFALLNQGKANVALDLRIAEERARLVAAIAKADIVIEAARPRGLLQLGIDAEQLVRSRPGLVWVSITGHGADGPAADWVGFGDDCGVAAGLAGAMRNVAGSPGFVGDAIADPLTGIVAASTALQAWQAGAGGRYFLSMRGTVAQAMAEDRALRSDLLAWREAEGQPFPVVPARPAAPAALVGQHNDRWPC